MLAPPFCRMRTRSPSCPRMAGRPALGPKYELATPGRPSSVAPRVADWRRRSASPVSTVAGATMSLSPSGLPVTTTVGSVALASLLAAEVCASAGWARASGACASKAMRQPTPRAMADGAGRKENWFMECNPEEGTRAAPDRRVGARPRGQAPCRKAREKPPQTGRARPAHQWPPAIRPKRAPMLWRAVTREPLQDGRGAG